MNKEALQQANVLENQISVLKDHRVMIGRYTNDLRTVNFEIDHHDSNNYSQNLMEEFFIIPPTKLMELYVEALDKKVAELERQIAAL